MKIYSAAAPPPAPARPPTAPRPIRRLPKSTGIPSPPKSIPAPARAGVPPPSACLPPAPASTTAAVCTPIRRRLPRRTGSAEHTGPEPPPAVPAWCPCARPRPTYGRAGADATQSGPPALSVAIGGGEGLGINFDFESPTAVEGGGLVVDLVGGRVNWGMGMPMGMGRQRRTMRRASCLGPDVSVFPSRYFLSFSAPFSSFL
ncbi:hypothetical protein B0H13DRAFT_1189171 [Mycena leptocephala]|nr:hypothetical protein B0H13DRAFT_1189171 [Mycena leptocephala]